MVQVVMVKVVVVLAYNDNDIIIASTKLTGVQEIHVYTMTCRQVMYKNTRSQV